MNDLKYQSFPNMLLMRYSSDVGVSPFGLLILNCNGGVVANFTNPAPDATSFIIDLFADPGPYEVRWNYDGSGYRLGRSEVSCQCTSCPGSWEVGGVESYVYLCPLALPCIG